MKNYRGYILPAASLSLLLLLNACSGEKRTAPVADGPGPGSGALSVSIIPQEPSAGDELIATVKGAGGEATYRWEVDGQEAGGGDRLDASLFNKGQEVSVTVRSGGASSAAKTVIVNAPPVVDSVVFMPAILSGGADITAEAVGHDPDDDFITYKYQWFVNGEELYMETGPVLGREHYMAGGAVTLKVTPFDGEAQGEAFTSKPEYVRNAPPRFTSVPPGSFKSRVYSYKVEAIDPDGDSLTYKLVKAPKGMTIDNTGLITWPIGPGDNGTHSVEIAVDDGFGTEDTQSYEITIELTEK